MAVAGRVAIVPQDEYDNTKAYKRLDMVTYTNGLYVAKKDNSGILPTNVETWMKIGQLTIQTMTDAVNGIGRPDGETIVVDSNGVFSAVNGAKLEVVDSVPELQDAENGVLYLIRNVNAVGDNVYDMYTLLDDEVACINKADTYKRIVKYGANLAVADWKSDTTYENYSYRAAISISSVTAEYIPMVIFGLSDAVSGNFAPISNSDVGVVYIYATEKPTDTIMIPAIICERGNM